MEMPNLATLLADITTQHKMLFILPQSVPLFTPETHLGAPRYLLFLLTHTLVYL